MNSANSSGFTRDGRDEESEAVVSAPAPSVAGFLVLRLVSSAFRFATRFGLPLSDLCTIALERHSRKTS